MVEQQQEQEKHELAARGLLRVRSLRLMVLVLERQAQRGEEEWEAMMMT